MSEEGDSLTLYCHGSLRYQAVTVLLDTQTSSLDIRCAGGKFVKTEDQVFFFIKLIIVTA